MPLTPDGISSWDIKLKNSPEKTPYAIANQLARKNDGANYSAAPTYDVSAAVSRRFDTIGQMGNAANANTQNVVARKQAANHQVRMGEAQNQYNSALSKQSTQTNEQFNNQSNSSGFANLKGTTAGQGAINLASTFTKTPYVWGGTTPKGFDCSGLVQYVYGKMGISMPRVSQQQAKQGTVTSIKNLIPGDLVAWGSSPGTSTHIAIYAGNGKIWEAARKGTNVRTRSISANERGIMGISLNR